MAKTTAPAHAAFETLGREAFANGKSPFPMACPEVYEAVKDLPVGGGAAEIMGAFNRGWFAANMAAPVPM